MPGGRDFARYWQRSAECAQMAEKADNTEMKSALLNMARCWLELAKQVQLEEPAYETRDEKTRVKLTAKKLRQSKTLAGVRAPLPGPAVPDQCQHEGRDHLKDVGRCGGLSHCGHARWCSDDRPVARMSEEIPALGSNRAGISS